MSDSDFVDVGDELVVRIAGYPVATAKVTDISFKGNWIVSLYNEYGELIYNFHLPPNFKEHETLDGYGHGSQPLTGVENGYANGHTYDRT